MKSECETLFPKERVIMNSEEVVEHPSHYQLDITKQDGKHVEVMDIIKDTAKSNQVDPESAFSYGSAIKYLLRYNQKGDPRKNLGKAIYCIQDMLKDMDDRGDTNG